MFKVIGLFVVGIICLIIIPAGVAWSDARKECSEDSSGSTQQEEVEQLRQTFFSNEGHEIQSALNELEAIEAEWITRKEKLAAICHIIDRNPNLDQDYQLWTERLNQLETDRQKLNNMAGDAFLAYAKFQLALDPISEELYQRALKEGLIVAAELRRQYQMLKELKGKLEEAFIWPEKFRLTPSAEHKAELSARITECNTIGCAVWRVERDVQKKWLCVIHL